ncbi:MAG: DUF4430 domain-containing protein [Candidatus Magasanikbacteria bacterium]|nr:DUF4430 domain-containing protein [Candidatus Magasanikbacteria bacterium]
MHNKHLIRLWMTLTFLAVSSADYLLLPHKAAAPKPPTPVTVAQNLPWSNIATNTTISDPQSQPKTPTPASSSIPKNTTPLSVPSDQSTPAPLPTPIAATIIINGQIYPLQLPEKSTAYDAMAQLVRDKKISVVFKEFSTLGYFVDEVDGVRTDKNSGKYWIYYLNGKPAQMGISNYILKNNDSITWKYEAPQF